MSKTAREVIAGFIGIEEVGQYRPTSYDDGDRVAPAPGYIIGQDNAGRLIEALDAAGFEIVPKTQWRPIETAPKDKAILGCCQWDSGEYDVLWVVWSDTYKDFLDVTHAPFDDDQELKFWQPIPEPPAP